MEKRERFYWAKAKAGREGGFIAEYGAPGLVPGVVRDEGGAVAVFATEDQAETAATQRLLYVLNHLPAYARKHGGKDTYQKPTGPEFAEMVAGADATLTAVAYVFGQRLSKIQEWITGIDEKGNATAAPHWARVLLKIFAKYPETFDFALKLTEDFASSKRPSPSKLNRPPREIDTAT